MKLISNTKAGILLLICLTFLFGCTQPSEIQDIEADTTAVIEDAASRSGSAFHLESKVDRTTYPTEVTGTYWTARDLEDFPIGNHHFIVIVFNSSSQAARVCNLFPEVGYTYTKNEKGTYIYYTTLGIGKNSSLIDLNVLYSTDLQAMKEVINPDKYTSWWKPDYDLEGHRVTTSESFMKTVIQLAINFKNSRSTDYKLLSDNCAAWTNTLFKVAGVSASFRDMLGDFEGLDIGESNLIDETLFY